MTFIRSRVLFRVLATILAFGSGLFAAEPGHSTVTVNTPDQSPSPATNNTPQVDHGLSIGKSKNENVLFKPHLEYEQRQNAEALQKLERIPALRASSNHTEIAHILRDVVNSDTSSAIKHDATRLALLALADDQEGKGHFEQAQQFLAEFVQRYPKDPYVPEVLLRQAYLYQKMGAFGMAIAKLYDVSKASFQLEAVNLVYAQRITLTAQSEIAESHYQHGKYEQAADLYERLLVEGSEELNSVVVKTKLIRSLSKANKPQDVARHAVDFLNHYAHSDQQAEVRYLLAAAYKALGRKQEALRQLLLLLEAAEITGDNKWRGWKMQAGNEIGNQLFLEGDYINAVVVYKGLLALDETASWKIPIHYQIGLCFERLMQPDEAIKAYSEIIVLAQKSQEKRDPSLQMVVDMARFRSDILSWKKTVDKLAPAPEPKVAEKLP